VVRVTSSARHLFFTPFARCSRQLEHLFWLTREACAPLLSFRPRIARSPYRFGQQRLVCDEMRWMSPSIVVSMRLSA